MRAGFLTTLLVLLFLALRAQDFLLPSEFIYRLSNNLTVLTVEAPDDSNVTIDIFFNYGAFVEKDRFDDLTGILSYIVYKDLKQGVASIPGNQVSYTVRQELVDFNIKANSAYLQQTLDSLGLAFQTFEIDSDQLNDARNYVYGKWSSLSNNADHYLQDTLEHKLWGSYYSMISSTGNYANVDTADAALLNRLYQELICASNGFVTIQAPFDNRTIRQQAVKGFDGWQTCRYLRTSRNMVPEFQPLIVSNQTVLPACGQPGMLTLAYQGPTVINYVRSALASLLMADILNHSMPADSDSIAFDMHVDFDLYKHAAPLTMNISVTDSQFCNFYLHKDSLLLKRMLHAMEDTNSLKAAKERVIEAIANYKNTTERINAYGKYWSFNFTGLVSYMADSIQDVKMADIESSFYRFVFQKPYIALLQLSDSVNTCDSCFVSTFENADHYQFYFKKNTGTYTDTAASAMLNSLYQHLRINPDINVKLIGYSGSDEQSKINDEKLLKEFKDKSGFYVYPAQLVPTNNIRLEVYRTMLVANYLLKRGLPSKQVTATSERHKTNEVEDVKELRKVDVRFYY